MANEDIKQGSYVLAQKFLGFGNTKKALEYFEKAEISKQEWYDIGKNYFLKNTGFALGCWKHVGIKKTHVIKSLDILRKKYFFKAKYEAKDASEESKFLGKVADIENLMKKIEDIDLEEKVE